MAISAVGWVSGGSVLRLYRPLLAEGPDAEGPAAEGPRRGAAAPSLAPVEATPALAGREDADPAAAGREAGRLGAEDPRGADSILNRRLDDLLGQKGSMERARNQAKGERSAEVVNQLAQLKSRDSAVRSHEAAHVAAGGRYITGGASYSYQRGPDGVQYAVGGEVGIDTSPVPGKPEETAQKMRIVRAAALAPSEPSGPDLAVAAAAAQAEAEALAEMAQARAEAASARYRAEAGAGQAGTDRSAPRTFLDMVA
jgi:hypothetical protein